MGSRFWLRGAAVVTTVGLMAAGSAAQARDLACTERDHYVAVPLRISDNKVTAAFGDDPASLTLLTKDQMNWTGPENGHGYRASYVLDLNTGALVRSRPVMFDKGLTSMWPVTYDCADRVDPSRN